MDHREWILKNSNGLSLGGGIDDVARIAICYPGESSFDKYYLGIAEYVTNIEYFNRHEFNLGHPTKRFYEEFCNVLLDLIAMKQKVGNDIGYSEYDDVRDYWLENNYGTKEEFDQYCHYLSYYVDLINKSLNDWPWPTCRLVYEALRREIRKSASYHLNVAFSENRITINGITVIDV